MGDSVRSEDKQGPFIVEDDVLPCITAKGVCAVGSDTTGELRQRDLGNASGLVWAGEGRVLAVSGGELCARPASVEDIAEGGNCLFVDGPVLIAFLDPKDGGAEVLV